jgi:hypothetical protein
MVPPLIKYPRTRHLEGSGLQKGDEDLAVVRFAELRALPLVVEEKMDGANCGVGFDDAGELLLQSRGHYLTGGGRERHFDLFKQWARCHADAFRPVLGARYVMFGEWLWATHTVHYDALPHYFMEFDVYDRERAEFLDTPRRRALLAGLPVVAVRVLHEGPVASMKALRAMVGRSAFRTARVRDALREKAVVMGLDPVRVLAETDATDLMEGLYVKHEAEGVVRGRYKFVRGDFLQRALDGDHWLDRPLIPNGLAAGVDLFGQA